VKRSPSKPTREKLIEAALYLFWLKGYEGTSIADILEKSDVNPGSFYHFFPRKEDLLLAVLQLYLDSLDSIVVGPVRERIADPIERIFGILEFYRRNLVATGCTYGCPIGRLALEIAPELTEVHRRLAANFAGWTAAVERCLDDARGRFPADADLPALARFVLTVMEGGVMQARVHRDLAPFDASVAQLRAYFRLLTALPPSPGDQADGSGDSPASETSS
jgi:AcrR family transcriptional regulator